MDWQTSSRQLNADAIRDAGNAAQELGDGAVSASPDTPAPQIKRRGLMLVLSSPSGAGKTSIARRLLELEPELSLSISVTTRPRRRSEVEGRDYHFIDRTVYDAMIAAGELLEHAEVYGNGYGTPRRPVEGALAAGRDVLFDIDWQGTQQLQAAMGEDLVTIFILPPSMAELERRLRERGTDSEDVIRDRMSRAASEISHWPEYEYVLVNTDADKCLEQVRSIVAAERLKRQRQIGLVPFVRDLIGPVH
jgi:guanylate kinase